MTNQRFTLDSGPVRRGRLSTKHGLVHTPCIVPMIAHGSFGPVEPLELKNAGVQMIAADGLEFSIEPGTAVIQASGGLGAFLNWSGPLLTFAGLFSATDKLKKNAARLGFRYHAPFTKADKRMDANSAVTMQAVMASDLPIAAFQKIDYYAPVDDLLSSVQVNNELQTAATKLSSHIIPVILGGGIKQARQAAVDNWDNLDAVLIDQLPDDDDAEWQRIIDEMVKMLPTKCLRIVIASTPAQLSASLCEGIDIIITGLPLVDAVQGMAYSASGCLPIKQVAYQSDTRQLSGHSIAYWHYLHHQGGSVGVHGLTLNNFHYLLDAVQTDGENEDVEYTQTSRLLKRSNGGNK